MSTIKQTITSTATSPNAQTMTPAAFDIAAAAKMAELTTMGTDLNTWAGQANTVAGEINTNATTATTQAGIATTQATTATTQAGLAAASAASAVSSPGTNATSSTSDTIALGTTTITIQTSKSIVVGMWVIAADTSSPAVNYMAGPVTAYNSGTGSLTYTANVAVGSGTLTAWTVSLTGIPGSTPSISWKAKTTTYTAVSQDRIAGDTSSAAFTVTLPSSPSVGDWVKFMDGGAAWGTNNLTVARNGSNIDGAAADFVCDVSGGIVEFVCVASNSWRTC